MICRYLLVDGARYPNALARLYNRHEALEVEPLYFGTPWHPAADLGPLLVSADADSALLRDIETDAELRASATVICSQAPGAAVVSHLRGFNRVADVTGGETLLRYADPLVAWFWLSSYSAEALGAVMGPISEWHIAEPSAVSAQQESPRWRVFSHAAKPADPQLRISILGRAQLSALEQAGQLQLKGRLYRWLQQHRPAVLSSMPEGALDDWFNARLADASACGLTTERSFAVWCDLSLCEGNDFAAAPQGSYQRWLAEQQVPPAQTPDQQIQHYYRSVV